MIKLSYCTFGLTELALADAIQAVDSVGYPGVELSFHRDQFNPFEITQETLTDLRRLFKRVTVKPACVATASHFFFPARPHEPSLMCPDLAGRKRRIDLVRRGIELARELEIPQVTFGSGFVRAEHLVDPCIDPHALLVDSVRRCLDFLRPGDDITLLIEPEPGMHIETLDKVIALVNEIDSPNFRLHLDLCHIYCSEPDCVSALVRAAPYARYLHISDAKAGCNLKVIPDSQKRSVDLDFADYLVYFPDTAAFLLLDREHPMYFSDEPLSPERASCIEETVMGAGIPVPARHIAYGSLHAGATEYDDEVFTYLISVPGISFDVLDRARPIVNFLRANNDAAGRPFMPRRVANTLTGIVHYHDIPGEGTLDFAACFKALNDNGFSGYGSVELYHHVGLWEKALGASYRHLSQFV